MSYYDYEFEAPIERLAIGNQAKTLYYNVVILPAWCQDKLPFETYPKLRIIGEIGEHPIRGAWNPVADGRKYFILSAAFLKQAELAIGDMTEVRFNIDDQEFVDIPVELDAALHGDERLAHLWDALTAGKKRFYAYQIASAKQAVTRQKRLLAVIKNLQEAALSS